MVVSYSSLNRFETPILTLCNPGSEYDDGVLTNIVGMLTDVSDMEIVFNFNSPSELNFRITKVMRENADDNQHTFKMFKSVQNRRLIFVEGIGYFMIVNIEDGYDGSIQYKDVRAESIDIEIQQKMIPFIEDGTYRFSSNAVSGEKGIFEKIVETLPLWTIGDVDAAIADKYRTFEDVATDLNCLGFMVENMQEAYECIFIFDPIHREINVYDQNNYVHQTDIHLTKDDIINSINISENADDLYTAISVLGNEDVMISAINPLGTNTIYNFDYYLEWMTTELREKVENWQSAVSDAFDDYYDLNLEYYQDLESANNYQLELQKIDTQITMYQRCRDNIVAEAGTDLVASYNSVIVENGGTPISIGREVRETMIEIDGLIASSRENYDEVSTLLNTINEAISEIRDDIVEIHDTLSFSEYFTPEELEELSNYIFEGSYSDEYVVITESMSHEEQFGQMKILYDRAIKQLEKVSRPTQEFTIDAENFLFVKEFEHWSEQIETGCLINTELDVDDIALLFLSNITVNYEDHSLGMTFGNRFNKYDPRSLFENALGSINKTANTLSYVKDTIYPIKNGEFNSMKEAIQTSRDLTMGSALSSNKEEVVIDASGYTGRKVLESGEYDPHQVKITGKNIVFTDDAWDTAKTAIGELILQNGDTIYGINAEAIIGSLIIGNSLRILDNNGNDLLTVVDGKISTQVSEVGNRISALEQTADGISIRVQTLEDNGDPDHITTSTGYTFDSDGLNIYREGDEMQNLLDNTGMHVKRSGEEVLTADNEGVVAVNLTSRQYLTIGKNSRFEDYSDGTDTNRTACFYIGG